MKTIKDADVKGKRVFLRVDLNVPMSGSTVSDDFKILSVLPTIRLLHSRAPKRVIIGSHLGRPGGKYVPGLSLEPVYHVLRALVDRELGVELAFEDIWRVGDSESPWVLVENLRFNAGEEDADPEDSVEYRGLFAKSMDMAIVDAFGCLHRRCGSIEGTGLPSYPGLLIQRELDLAKEVMDKGVDLMVLGGKKVSGKVKLVKSLAKKTRRLFITGGLAFPFLRYMLGKEVGRSIVGNASQADIKEICEVCETHGTEVILPVDFTVLCGLQTLTTRNIPADGCALDIGAETIEMLEKEVERSSSVFWNGPPGMFEDERFSKGTRALVQALESLKARGGGEPFCGGGETAAAVRSFGNYGNFTYVSTGGGALMKLLGGEDLPGLDFLLSQA